MAELARLAAITKNFGGVRALRGVNFEVRTGEVHALVGENGAGKSTPMRVLGGEMTPSSGEVSIAGEHVDFRGPREARAHGIAIIHQELALAPDLSVAENIFLGELSGVISWSTLRRRASELIASLGFDIDPSLRAGALTVAHQQVVEIAKALSRKISGIAAPRYILAVYVISGALAGLAGIISTSRTGVGSAPVGVGAELDVIAAVVIGGASLMGGRGGVINTLLGALVMGIIANIMNLAGVPGYNQNVYMGLIIVLATLIQYGAGSLKR